MRTWTTVASRTCCSGFLTSERVPRSSFGIGGGSSSFKACDSGEAGGKGRSGEALCLIRELLRVDTIDLMWSGRSESNTVVAEMGMSHEKTRTFIHSYQVVTARQGNEGKVQCVA